jgi:hypothetical protein
MQAGLLQTYQAPASNRSQLAWGLSALLVGFYLVLYYTEVLERPAQALHLGNASGLCTASSTRSPWSPGGVFMLRRHGNSPYTTRADPVRRVRAGRLCVRAAMVMGVLGRRSTTSATSGP